MILRFINPFAAVCVQRMNCLPRTGSNILSFAAVRQSLSTRIGCDEASDSAKPSWVQSLSYRQHAAEPHLLIDLITKPLAPLTSALSHEFTLAGWEMHEYSSSIICVAYQMVLNMPNLNCFLRHIFL